jgi:uncharacterized membrane protein YhhN
MKTRTSIFMHLLFVIIVAIELTGRFTDNINLEYFVKPLIMIWMAAFFLVYRKKKALTIPVLMAFFFSWVGDNFLMFSGKNELFFYAGVGGFFFAQLMYIYVFARYSEMGGKGYLGKNLYPGILFLAYLTGIYALLYPNLEGIMKPVILVYAISLIGMSMMALNRKGRVSHDSYLPVFLGSVLFVISDSMIAINKFHTEIPLAGFWIMITYISAQYLIMRGLIREQVLIVPNGGNDS